MGGDARNLLEQIRQHDIDIETGGDRIGDQRRIIEHAEGEIEEFEGELDRAEKARVEAEGSLKDASETLVSANQSLKQAAKDEEGARDAIQSGDKHARDLKRILGKATEAVDEAHSTHSQVRLQADRALSLIHI